MFLRFGRRRKRVNLNGEHKGLARHFHPSPTRFWRIDVLKARKIVVGLDNPSLGFRVEVKYDPVFRIGQDVPVNRRRFLGGKKQSDLQFPAFFCQARPRIGQAHVPPEQVVALFHQQQ